jgi:hypothetical protein
VDLIIWSNLKKINELIENGDYREAKSKQLVWMVLGFILGGLLPGILLLIGCIKYDELIRHADLFFAQSIYSYYIIAIVLSISILGVLALLSILSNLR